MKKLLIIGLLLVSKLSLASESNLIVKFNKDRTVRIAGMVAGNAVIGANQILSLAIPDATEKKDIYILINSPGGGVYAGEILINSMKIAQARGYKFVCGVSFLAASMAFSILDACDVRYALDSSKLLFHSAGIGPIQRVNAFTAAELLVELTKINGKLIKRLLESTGMNSEVFAIAFYQEKLWDADEFLVACKKGYITIATDYQGVDGIYNFN